MEKPPAPHLVPPPPELQPEPSTPKRDTGLMPVLRVDLRGTKWLTRANALGLVALLGALGVSSDKVKGWLVRDAVAQDAGVKEIRRDVDALQQFQKAQGEFNNEIAKDLRALYRFQKTGAEQPRLERELVFDGGTR